MRSLLYMFLLNTLVVGLSSTSFANKNSNLPRCDCENLIFQTIDFLCGKNWIEETLGDEFIRINGKPYQTNIVKRQLLDSINIYSLEEEFDFEAFNRNDIIDRLSKRFIKAETLSYMKKIDRYVLMFFINEDYPDYYFEDVEKTHEIVQILLLNGVLSPDTLKRVLEKDLMEIDASSDIDEEEKC